MDQSDPAGQVSLASLRQRLRAFVAEHHRDQFHSPGALSMALIAEAHMNLNERKYPAAVVRGSAKKYTEY